MPESPVGSIIAYAGEIPPATKTFDWEQLNGWLRCDGRGLRRADYSGLY
jgi:hypothetical protein